MAGVDDFVQGPPDSTGKKIDNDVLTIGVNEVYRQRIRIAGAAAGELADVRNATPSASDYGLVTRPVASVLTPAAPTKAIVGRISSEAVAANSSRKGLVCRNASESWISFGLDAPAVLGSGITLDPGGRWEMDEATFTTAAINAIATERSELEVQEFS
jgi:hypothetical protein